MPVSVNLLPIVMLGVSSFLPSVYVSVHLTHSLHFHPPIFVFSNFHKTIRSSQIPAVAMVNMTCISNINPLDLELFLRCLVVLLHFLQCFNCSSMILVIFIISWLLYSWVLVNSGNTVPNKEIWGMSGSNHPSCWVWVWSPGVQGLQAFYTANY